MREVGQNTFVELAYDPTVRTSGSEPGGTHRPLRVPDERRSSKPLPPNDMGGPTALAAVGAWRDRDAPRLKRRRWTAAVKIADRRGSRKTP